MFVAARQIDCGLREPESEEGDGGSAGEPLLPPDDGEAADQQAEQQRLKDRRPVVLIGNRDDQRRHEERDERDPGIRTDHADAIVEDREQRAPLAAENASPIGRPRRVQDPGSGQRHGLERLPVAQSRDVHRGAVQHQHVREEEQIVGFAFRQQERGRVAAEQREQQGGAGVVSQRQRSGHQRCREHQHKCDGLRDELIKRERGEERKVENRGSQRLDALREGLLSAMPEAVSCEDRGESGQDAEDHTAAGADPVVVDGVLEEERNAEQHGDDADPVDPREPDVGFERWRLGIHQRLHRRRWQRHRGFEFRRRWIRRRRHRSRKWWRHGRRFVHRRDRSARNLLFQSENAASERRVRLGEFPKLDSDLFQLPLLVAAGSFHREKFSLQRLLLVGRTCVQRND